MRNAGDTTAAPAPAKRVWYRRRAVVVTAAVLVVVAITVISDLPQHSSRAQQISDETTVINEIKTDASSCLYASKEAFMLYADAQHGLTSSERGTLPGLLRDDQGACSFTNGSIYDLANIEVPGSAAGRDIGDVVNTVTLWVTSDALAAIEAIMTLSTEPTNASALKALTGAERLLASDRAKVTSEMHAADEALQGANLPGPGLPSLPVPKAGT